MNGTIPRPPGGGGLDALRRQLNFTITSTDEAAEELLLQVVALEALIVARWPRSMLLRRRLRRELRASVRHNDGEDFTSKRINSLATGWIVPG